MRSRQQLHRFSVELNVSLFCPWFAKKRQGLLNLEPEYQRGFVWDKTASSRLVETILLGLPVPEVLHARPTSACTCSVNAKLPMPPRLLL